LSGTNSIVSSLSLFTIETAFDEVTHISDAALTAAD